MPETQHPAGPPVRDAIGKRLVIDFNAGFMWRVIIQFRFLGDHGASARRSDEMLGERSDDPESCSPASSFQKFL